MQFEWGDEKDRRNLAKHKVSFETARLVFDDPLAVSVRHTVVGDEERWRTLGRVGGVVVLLVAHTYRCDAQDEIIRIISARKATPRERRIYEHQPQTGE